MPTIEVVVRQQSRIVAEQIKSAAQWAETEEDLRIETEKILYEFKKQAKLLDLKGHHEVTIGKGRADSVYNYVVIEYKKPTRLTDSNESPANKEVIQQLKDRLRALELEEKRKIEKLFGVGFDGHRYIFVRFRNNKWDVNNPLPVTSQTTERFLRALLALAAAGKAYQPEYLSGDFGSDSPLSQSGIETCYFAITNTENPKAQVLFDEWKILFGEIGGYDVKSLDTKIQILADFYQIKGKPNPAALLFSVHTYYALFMKLLAAEIMNYFNPMFPSILSRFHQAPTSEKLKRELRDLERGGIYRQMGITNFLEGDMFSWYLDAWETTDKHGKTINMERVIRDLVGKMDEYDPVTLSVEPGESRDLLKELYQNLFPKKVRHDLGEYYTPDWLAQWVIEKVGFDGNPDKRILDPACGSGTFLVLAIQKIREYADEKMISEKELIQKIKENVIGFDLNPLAVIAARLNYLIAIRDLIHYGAEIEIPIYLCDSVMTPSEYGQLFTASGEAAAINGEPGAVKQLNTSVGPFFIPTEIAKSRSLVAKYAEELERCVQNNYSPDEFIKRLEENALPVENEKLHIELFTKLTNLSKRDKNGIWARIIKNAFAPLFIKPVDYVIGNPPWVNWESLPDEYRKDSIQLWHAHGMKPPGGIKSIMGHSKMDISALMTYVAMDNYLGEGGKLGFVITQSLFKTSGAGQGFRRFKLASGRNIAPVYCDDMVDIKPFEAANRTAVMVLDRDVEVEYPITYVLWKKQIRRRIDHKTELKDVLEQTKRIKFVAKPVDDNNRASSWMTGREKALNTIQKVLGKSEYIAHEGVNTGGANAVFWFDILEELEDGKVLVRNITKGAKRKVDQIEVVIEKDLLYPLIRGKDVHRWNANSSGYILMTKPEGCKEKAIPVKDMKIKYPNTYAYLSRFRNVLEQRRDAVLRRSRGKIPFYSIGAVSIYTFAPWKVVWARMGSALKASVIGSSSNKPIITQETVSILALESDEEAHYVSAVINSLPYTFAINTYSQVGGKSFGSPHILEYCKIYNFERENSIHKELVSLSVLAHNIADKSDLKMLEEVENEINKLAAQLWGLSYIELKEIKKSLREMEA